MRAQARLAGAAAVRRMVALTPPAYVRQWAAPALRSLLTALRWLPEHCVAERQGVDAGVAELVRKAMLNEEPPPPPAPPAKVGR